MRQKLIFFILCIMGFSLANKTYAADFVIPTFRDKNYAGRYVSQSISDPIPITTNLSREVIVKIKNTGRTTWKATGANYVSIYTVDPNYRVSVFYDEKSWLHNNQPAKLIADTVPGATGEFKIKLKAPAKTGRYMERFYLAAENHTWIQGSYFFLDIKVSEPDNTTSGNSVGNLKTADDSGEYKAHLLAFSARKLEIARGGETINFIVRYINDGTKEWQQYAWQEAGSIATDNTDVPNISDTSWLSRQLISTGDNVIKPKETLEINFKFRAPQIAGNYILRFQLSANEHTTSGGILELPIHVAANAPADFQEILWQNKRSLIAEPNIRVGLYKTTEAIKFISDFRYEILVDNNTRGWLEPNEIATISYAQGVYHFQGGAFDFSTHGFIRLVPKEQEAYFILPNYTRLISWKGNKNFNAYRGTLEYVYSPKSAQPYLINELPLDAYIAGIGETSNGAAMEYIKAILVAARSYAYYNILLGQNAPQPSFDVFPTTADQLYLGYNSEILMPRVVQAAQATFGEMVTYNNNPVTTPYFGNSDGQTRGWREVWGGTDKPWLKPVQCIYDQDKNLFGHGVGMSAYDASRRAAEDDWTYQQLLKYYYTDTNVEKIY